MDPLLAKISEKYNIKHKGVAPISDVDAEIINELKILVGKLKLGLLYDTLDSYKKADDLEILELLVSINVDFDKHYLVNPILIMEENEDGEEEETEIKGSFMPIIGIGDCLVKITDIITISKSEHYNSLRNKMCYNIIVNENVETKFVTVRNQVVPFDNLEHRDREMELLKLKLISTNVRFF